MTIKGFRSFDTNGVTIQINPALNAFIGINSSGKTSALEALRKLFGLTNAERELRKQDFHIAANEHPKEITERDIYIEVKILFKDDDKSIPHFFKSMVIGAEGETPYLRIRLEAKWESVSYSQDGMVDTKIWFITVPDGEEETEDSKKPFHNRYRGLIQVLYVPAIRQPAEQLKYTSGSILYRVLSIINFDDTFMETMDKKLTEVTTLFEGVEEFKDIQNKLNKYWQEFHKDQRYRETSFNFSSSDVESLLKKLEIKFKPTETDRPYQINELGEGYRSLFYMTLVCALLEVEETIKNKNPESDKIYPELTILAIEEPENHIAPQLLGRVVSILKRLSNTPQSQVFLSSHTPAIIKRIDPEAIFHFRITNSQCTEINKIILPGKHDDAFKYIKEAVKNYPEIYFAKLVVIGEGESEEIIFNRLMEVYDIDFDDNFITFAPLGNRFVNHIWRLLETLHIPYITLLDLDLERETGGWSRIEYILKQLIEFGVDKKTLLEVDGGVLSEPELNKMHEWKIDVDEAEEIDSWVTFLEKYNVYYSSPLDLDFLMLIYYPEEYTLVSPPDRGPQIPDKAKEKEKFEDKVQKAIQATLKSEKAKAETYSEEEKELMIWYNYHFLGRGKPVTHINALSRITDENLLKYMPPVFEKIFDKIQKMLED